MKKFSLLLILLFSLSLVNCEKAPDAPKADTQAPVENTKPQADAKPLKLDLAKSTIKWIGTKVTGKHNGTIKLKSGEVLVSGQKVVGGKFVVDMTTLEDLDLEGNDKFKEKLETHLKSDDFFSVEKFPETKFEITSVKEEGNNKVNITGNLTIKDVTKSISFPASIEVDANKNPVAAKANFNIDRFQWGVVYKGKADDLIKSEINFDLDLKVGM